MERGKKHSCSACGTLFYDLGKDNPICPNCGQNLPKKKAIKKGSKSYSKTPINEVTEETQSKVVIGRFKNEIFRNEKEGYLIFAGEVLGKKEELKFSGDIKEFKRGNFFIASGDWVNNKKFGLQFSYKYLGFFASFPLLGIKEFLSGINFEGLGSVTVQKILDEFGEGVFDILNYEPSRLEKIGTLKISQADEIGRQWLKTATDNSFAIFLSDLGLRKNIRSQMETFPKEEILETLFGEPYSLIQKFSGVGFKIADQVALQLGVERSGIPRILAGVKFTLDEASKRDGHCGLPIEKLVQSASNNLNEKEEIIRSVIEEDLTKEILVKENIGDIEVCFLKELHICETALLERIEVLRNQEGLESTKVNIGLSSVEAGLDFSPTGDQIEAIREALESSFSVITGGPGTGKTTIIKGLIAALKAVDLNFSLCAPTGRASKRLAEASGEEAKTIHRLLEYGSKGFKKNAKNLLEDDVIVCDEASMIDVELMQALFNAIGDKTKVILVGDVDQLPPVGPGQPFRDIVNSRSVHVRYLEKNFRQVSGSSIALAASAFNEGHMPSLGQDSNINDFSMIKANDSKEVLEKLTKLFDKLPKIRDGKFDPKKDVQVLTPMNKRELGTSNLNQLIQNLINPRRSGGIKVFDHTLSEGDKVIQTKNNYEDGVFNGDIGSVVKCDERNGVLAINFDGQRVEYKKAELSANLSLAYAITIHKSQGSEYPVVILIISNEHQFMLARNLIYTGITRGKELVIIIGQERAFAAASHKISNTKRWTLLSTHLVR